MLPAHICRQFYVNPLSRFRRRLSQSKGLGLDNQPKTLSDAPSSCHMSQVAEKLSTSSLWPTNPTSFEGKERKFAGRFHDDHGGRVFAVTVREVVEAIHKYK